MKSLADKVALGSLLLKNRIILSAMTRQRCDPATGIPNHIVAQYYSQRAGAGLILTQASSWAQRGDAFPGAANLFNKQQAEGWKKVTHSVHEKGGLIFSQLYHGGRTCLQQTTRGLKPWSSSKFTIRDKHRQFKRDHEAPHVMTIDDIETTKKQWKDSVKLAKQSGFDGIEVHGSNGYLIDCFFKTSVNNRSDKYGGDALNRCRFATQLIDIALEYFEPHQIGIKISPVSRYNDMYDDNPLETYTVLVEQLSKKKIGFVQIRQSHEPIGSPQQFPKLPVEQIPDVCAALRPHFNGLIIANEKFNAKSGLAKIQSGNADLISFGRPYISNPDLAERIIGGKQLNTKMDWKTFFRGPNGVNLQTKGYTDFPFYDQWKKQKI